MPNVVRFALSTARDQYISGVGFFRDGILDVDANRLDLVKRARYLVQPYRAVEIGIVDSATPAPNLPPPQVPPAPNTDPYPQYPTVPEVRTLVITDEAILDAQRAAFDAWGEGAEIVGGGGSRLPLMTIDTAGGAAITSKETYLNATISVTGADVPDYTGSTQIRGRGNYTWSLAKKPYRVKLTTAAPLLGLPSERDWALLANHTDATLLNTALAMNTGQQSDGLDWTPQSAFVDLVLNGAYLGVYQLIETVEISTAPRVPGPAASGTSGDTLTGTYLMEIDPQYGMAEPGFTTSKGVRVIYDDPKGDVAEQAAYISGWVQQFENALYGETFKNATTGYAPFIDRDSFIDWYLISELGSNQDSPFNSSCKLYKTRDTAGGKLHMGPLWDFDISFGNVVNTAHPTDGLYTRPGAKWIHRMFADPAFVAGLNTRWSAMVARLNDPQTGYAAVLDRVDREVSASRLDNHEKWDISSRWDSNVPAKKAWIAKRIAWLTAEFAASADGSRGDNTSGSTPVLTSVVAPAITGTPTTGQPLTVSTGTWSDSPDSYGYQWKRAGANITGATANTYTLQVADQGQAITCTVTAVKGGYTSGTATSNSVTPAAGASTAIAADNFNRADDAASLGSTSTGNLPWQATGTWGITSGAAVHKATSDGLATVDSAVTDHDVSVVLSAFTGGGVPGVVARHASPSNYIRLIATSATAVRIDQKINGSESTSQSFTVPSMGNGTVLRLVCSGSSVTAYVGGVQVATITTTLTTQTRVGLFSASPFEFSSNKFDDFSVSAI